MRRLTVLLCIAALAGCLDAGEPAGIRLGAESDLPTRPGARGLHEAPEWALGEWWTVRLASTFYGIEETMTIVVAGTGGPDYLVGFAGEIGMLPMILHSPHVGEVRRADLSHDAHDVPFKLLDFPLEIGKTWRTDYWGRGDWATFHVDDILGDLVQISFDARGGGKLVYDAQAGTVVRFETTRDTFEVTDHGFGYEGRVIVPAGVDLVFCHGRSLATSVVTDKCVAGGHDAPVIEVSVADVYDEATFGLLTYGGPTDAPTGAATIPYFARATAPDGSVYEQVTMPGETPKLGLWQTRAVDGTWDVAAIAPGDGLAMLEGVAYRVVTVDL